MKRFSCILAMICLASTAMAGKQDNVTRISGQAFATGSWSIREFYHTPNVPDLLEVVQDQLNVKMVPTNSNGNTVSVQTDADGKAVGHFEQDAKLNTGQEVRISADVRIVHPPGDGGNTKPVGSLRWLVTNRPGSGTSKVWMDSSTIPKSENGYVPGSYIVYVTQ